MKISGKQVELFRRIHRKYKVSFEFLTANFNKVVRLYKYATSRHMVIKTKFRLRKNRAFIIYNHLRKNLFQMKRTKRSIKSLSWTKRIKLNRQRLRAIQKLQHETVEDKIIQHEVEDGISEEQDEPTKLSPEHVQQKLKEQLDILKSGKRTISLLGRANTERIKPSSANPSAESSQRNSPNHFKENLLLSNILKRNPNLLQDASISNIIPVNAITTDKDKVNHHIEKGNVTTNRISATNRSNHLLSSLISNLKSQVNLPGASLSSASNTPCRRISLGRVSSPLPSPREEDYFSDDGSSSHSSDFHGFTEFEMEIEQFSSMTSISTVKKVVLEAQQNVKENVLDNFKNVEIPKKIEEGLVCDETPIQKINMPAISDEPRTISEKRMILLQKQNNMKYCILDDEHTIYCELQRRSNPLYKPNLDIAKHVQNSVVPITRDSWKASASLSTEKGKFFLQTANIDNIEYKIIGTRGNNYLNVLPKQNSMVPLKKVQSINCSQKCHRFSKDFKKLRIINPKKNECITKRKSLIPSDLKKQTGESMFLPNFVLKPCPLSKKCTTTNQSKNLPLEIYEMPKIELEVFPKIEKPLDDFVKPYLKMIMPSDNISPEWSEFAVSTLVVKNKRKLRSTRISSSRESFKFEIPFLNNENRILVRKIPEPFENNYNCQNLEFGKNINKSDRIGVDCVDMITDMIHSIALGLSENSIIKDDPDINYTNIEETNAMTITKKQPVATKEKHGNQKLVSRLKRPSATVTIDANDFYKKGDADIKECKEIHCRLGCVCQSIIGPTIIKKHCRKSSCMFKCGCKQNPENLEKIISNNDRLLLRKKSTAKLGKVKKDFCSTVELLSDNLINETQTKRKRLKRGPKRCDDYFVELDYITDEKSDTIDHNHNNDTLNKENTETPMPLYIFSDEKTIDKFKHCSVAVKKLMGLESVQPWCMVHCLYKCFCDNKSTSGIPFKIEKVYDIHTDIITGTVIYSDKSVYSFEKANDQSPIKEESNANHKFVCNNNHNKNQDSQDMKHEKSMPPKKKYYYKSCLEYGSRSNIIPVGWYRHCNKRRFMKFLSKNVTAENKKHQKALECKIRDSLMAQVDEPRKSENVDTIKESIMASTSNNTVNNFNDTDTAVLNSDILKMLNIPSICSSNTSPMITTSVTTSPMVTTRKPKKIADIVESIKNNIYDMDTVVSNSQMPKTLNIASLNISPMITRKLKKMAGIAETNEIRNTSIQNNTLNNSNDADTVASNSEMPKILNIASLNPSPIIADMTIAQSSESSMESRHNTANNVNNKDSTVSNFDILKISNIASVGSLNTSPKIIQKLKKLTKIADKSITEITEVSVESSHNNTTNNINATNTTVSNIDMPKISNITSVCSLNTSPMITRKKLKIAADTALPQSMANIHNNTPNNINDNACSLNTSPMKRKRKSKKLSKTIIQNNIPNNVNDTDTTVSNFDIPKLSNIGSVCSMNTALMTTVPMTTTRTLEEIDDKILSKITKANIYNNTPNNLIDTDTTISNLEISNIGSVCSFSTSPMITKRKLKKSAHRAVAENNGIGMARIHNNTSNSINDNGFDIGTLKMSNIPSICSLNTSSMSTAPIVAGPIVSSSLLTTSSAMTAVPSETCQDVQCENNPKLGGLNIDYTIDEVQTASKEFYNKLLLKLNLSVSKTMNSIRSIQKANTKHIPTPVPKTLNSHQWEYFLQAYLEELIFVWEIKLNTDTILAVTKTNIMPLVPNAISLINIKAMRKDTLSLIAKMLNAKIMNYKLKTISVLMTGHNGYWRIIGFTNSTNNYLEKVIARPTTETHPHLTDKINQLFQMLLERELKKMPDFLNKAESLFKPIQNNKKVCSPSVKATTSTLINNSEKSSASFKCIPKIQLPPSNIAIQKVPANEIESIYIPIPVVGNHRWLMLSLIPDFSHMYVPTWKNFLSYDKIMKAIFIAFRNKKTVRLGQGVNNLDVYATPEYINRIYIGPFPIDKKLDLILYQSIDGRMMLREDFDRIQNIKRVTNTSTVGYWLYMKNDELILRDEEQTSDYSFDKNINTNGNDCPIIRAETGKKQSVVSFSNVTSAIQDCRELDIITPASSLPDELLASSANQLVDPFNESILFRDEKNNLVNPNESVTVPLLQDSTLTNIENGTKANLTARGIVPAPSAIKNQNIGAVNSVPIRTKPILKRRMTEHFGLPPKKTATSPFLSIISNLDSLNLSLPSQSANVITRKQLLNEPLTTMKLQPNSINEIKGSMRLLQPASPPITSMNQNLILSNNLPKMLYISKELAETRLKRIKPILKRRMTEHFGLPPKKTATSPFLSIISNLDSLNLSLPSQSANVITRKQLLNEPLTTMKLQPNSINEIKGSMRLLQPASPPITSMNQNLILSNNLPKILYISKELAETRLKKNQTPSDKPILLQTEEKNNTIYSPISNSPATYQKITTQSSAKDIDHPLPARSVPSYNKTLVTESTSSYDPMEPEESIKSFKILNTKLPLLSINPITATNSPNTSNSNQTAIQTPTSLQSVAKILGSSKSSTTPSYNSIKDKNPLTLSDVNKKLKNPNASKLATQLNDQRPPGRLVVKPFIKRLNTTPIAVSLPAKVFISDAIQSTGMNSVAGITNASPTSVPSTGLVTNVKQSTVKNTAPRAPVNIISVATFLPSTGKNTVSITSNASSTTAAIPAKLIANDVSLSAGKNSIPNASAVATSVPFTVTDVIQSTEKNTAARAINASTITSIPPKLVKSRLSISARRNPARITNTLPKTTPIPGKLSSIDKIQATEKNTLPTKTNNTSSIATSVTGNSYTSDAIQSIINRMKKVPKTSIASVNATFIPSKAVVTDVIQSTGKIPVQRSTTASSIATSMQSHIVASDVNQSTGRNKVSRTSQVSSIPTSMPAKVFASDLIQSTGRNSVPRTTTALSKPTTALTIATVTSSSEISSPPTTSTGKNVCETNRTSVRGRSTSSPLKKVEAVSSEIKNVKSPKKGQCQYGFLVSTVMFLGKIPAKKMDTGLLIKIPHYNSPLKVDGIEKANETLHKYLSSRVKGFKPTNLCLSWKFISSVDPAANFYRKHNVQHLNKDMIITDRNIIQKTFKISTSTISSKDTSIQQRQIEDCQKSRKTVSGMKKSENNLKTNNGKETVPLVGNKEKKKIPIPSSNLIKSDVILIDDDEDLKAYDNVRNLVR